MIDLTCNRSLSSTWRIIAGSKTQSCNFSAPSSMFANWMTLPNLTRIDWNFGSLIVGVDLSIENCILGCR